MPSVRGQRVFCASWVFVGRNRYVWKLQIVHANKRVSFSLWWVWWVRVCIAWKSFTSSTVTMFLACGPVEPMLHLFWAKVWWYCQRGEDPKWLLRECRAMSCWWLSLLNKALRGSLTLNIFVNNIYTLYIVYVISVGWLPWWWICYLLYTAVEHLNYFLSLSFTVISHVAYDVVRPLVNRAPCTPFFFSPFCQLESKLYLFGSHYRVYHITSFRLLEDSITFCLTIMLYPKSLALWHRILHDLTMLTWDKPNPSLFVYCCRCRCRCCCCCCRCSRPCPCPRRPDSTWHRKNRKKQTCRTAKKNLDFMVKVRPFFAKYPTMRPLMGIKHDWKSPIPQIN